MLSVGQLLQERYQIIAKLGEGGMGAVYRAYDNRLNKECALKEMLTTPEMATNASAAAEQFKREASVLAALRHPNLPVVGDYFVDHGNNYLVMDFIEGRNLLHIIGAQGLPEANVLNYANQLLDVLEYIHSKGVVHRDIKPANIIVKPDGSLVLVDFGLVKVMDALGGGTLIWAHQAGTPEYAPPEQLKGITDPRSDIYSLGATLYHALTGRPPLDITDRSMKQMPGICQLKPTVSARTERVVNQALMMQPDKRWASAAAMRAELGGSSNNSTTAPPPEASRTAVLPRRARVNSAAPAVSPVASPRQRRQTMLVAVSIGAVALVIVVALVVALNTATDEGKSAAVTSTSTHTPEPVATATSLPEQPTATARVATFTAIPSNTPQPVVSNEQIIALAGGTQVLVRVPTGDFPMGAADNDPLQSNDKKPRHLVMLDEYWMGKTEVTNAQFAAFVNATGYKTTAEIAGSAYAAVGKGLELTLVNGANWRNPQGPSSNIDGKEYHPVVQISWDDATAYCKWATEVSGRLVRLPTEAEWEKAARGTDGRIYPWGNQAPDGSRMNYADKNIAVNWADKAHDDGYELTSPVGNYPRGASPYGALDMAGNAWEWVADWYDENYYLSSPASNPLGPASGEFRVIRGGCWIDFADLMHTAYGYRFSPLYANDGGGFRVAVSSTTVP